MGSGYPSKGPAISGEILRAEEDQVSFLQVLYFLLPLPSRLEHWQKLPAPLGLGNIRQVLDLSPLLTVYFLDLLLTPQLLTLKATVDNAVNNSLASDNPESAASDKAESKMPSLMLHSPVIVGN